MIIDQLPEISTVQETDEIPVERGTTTYKSTLRKLKDLVAPIITLTVGAFSSLPQTISNSKITVDMVVLSCELGNPTALTSDISWTTSDGKLTITGTMSGTTTAVITLGRTTY